MRPYQRIFGSGPLGLAVNLLLLIFAAYLERFVAWPDFGLPWTLRAGVLAVGALGTVIIIVWAQRALPVSARGKHVCTSGPFRWVRHPLYASFLSLFNFALAVYLDDAIYVAWALAVHPIWHRLIRYEEGLMERQFGDEYRNYARRTGRFFPRIIRRDH